MSLFSRFERRASSLATAWEVSDSLTAPTVRTKSGARVSQENSLNNIAVYACQSLIADGAASLPVDVYRDKGDGSREDANKPTWLKQPNPFETPFTFWHKVFQSLLSDGNVFIATLRNAKGNVSALHVLHPQFVEIEARPNGDPLYRVNGAARLYDRSEVLHIPAFSVPGFARGLSPIDVAREAIGLGLTMEEFGGRFFSQGTTMAGVISHPGVPKPDEARLLREMFRKSHAGINNSHAVGILTGGAQWQQITISPEQAQFLESRKFQKGEIALLYRVPAYMVDPSVTSTWGSGIEEQNTNFVAMTLMPWLIRVEQAISTNLLPVNVYMKFNVDSRLRAKTSDRYNAHKIALDAGIKNLDEVRAEEDLPPLPNGLGQDHYRPLNMGVLGEEPPAPEPAQPDPAAEDKPADVQSN